MAYMAEAEFLATARWKRKREKILRRDGYLCQRCKRYGRKVAATVVHHVVHYDDAPERAMDDANLVSLCDACHNREHPERAQNRGRPPRYGL